MRCALLLLTAAMAAPGQYFRGINLAGAEFGENVLPGTFGTHYWFNSDASFRYFAPHRDPQFRPPQDRRVGRVRPRPSGEVMVVLTGDGRESNTVTVAFR